MYMYIAPPQSINRQVVFCLLHANTLALTLQTCLTFTHMFFRYNARFLEWEIAQHVPCVETATIPASAVKMLMCKAASVKMLVCKAACVYIAQLLTQFSPTRRAALALTCDHILLKKVTAFIM